MSITGASSRFCESATRRMLQDSKAPHFEKTMTDIMLRRSESVVIPAEFTRTHGDIFHTPELSLTGPNGHSRPVMLKVRPYGPYAGKKFVNRVYLTRGWTEFVKENGFQVGNRIVFRMVNKSSFRVLLCSQREEELVFKNATLLSPKDEEEDNKTTTFGEFSEAPSHSEVYHRRVKQETAVPKCETSFNPAEAPVQQWHCSSPNKAKVVAAMKMSPTVREEDFVKHPGLATAVSLSSRFPVFLRKLTKVSVMGHDIRLELPFSFVKEHGHKFQAHVLLLGPSGSFRIVGLRIMANGRCGSRKVQIRQGWKDFALENGFKVGDVLLFSLVGFSKFVVQLFPPV